MEPCSIGGVGETGAELEGVLAGGGAHPNRGLATRGSLGDDLELRRKVAGRLPRQALELESWGGLLDKLKEHQRVTVPITTESCEGVGCERMLSIAAAVAECTAHRREGKVSGMEVVEGARFTLRLEREDAASVAYQFEVELGAERRSGSVSLELGAGAVAVASQPALPAWLESTIVGLVRSLWRARRDPKTAAPWPRRLTRWRHPEGAQVR